jgi:hypothetical protein
MFELQEKKVLFCKKEPKNSCPWHAPVRRAAPANRVKVFWFFFSKKNSSLACLRPNTPDFA